MIMRLVRVILLAGAVLGLLGGWWHPATAAAQQKHVPRFEPADCLFRLPDGVRVECGYLVVPEDRAEPGSATIRLHVATFRSRSDHPLPDPVIYLHGGPGGNALEAAALLFDGFRPFIGDRDLIMFDQRGTGYSEPGLACPEVIDAYLRGFEREVDPLDTGLLDFEALVDCQARLAADGNLGAYHSAASAADLADLRGVLGIDVWNLYGISYGTRLALTVMRDYPDGVRSVVLDSTYPLQVDLYADTPGNADRAFRALFDGCAADTACRSAYPNLEAVFYELVAELNGDPVRIPVLYPDTGRIYHVWISGYTVIDSLFNWLYDTTIIPDLPRIIFNMHGGDYSTLSDSIRDSFYNLTGFSEGMYYSVQCYEEVPFMDNPRAQQVFEQIDERLKDYFRGARFGMRLACEVWDIAEAATVENEPVRSDIPTLVLAGEYDPITPPDWGALASMTLPHSYFYSFPGFGHGVAVAGDCPMAMTLDFLRDPLLPPDASCLDTLSGPTFTVP